MPVKADKRIRNRNRIPTIKLTWSDVGEVKSYVIGKHIMFVEIEFDEDVENPCTSQDGFGMIRSLSHRHINNIAYDEALELLKTDEDVVALSYFEHGQSMWMVKDGAAAHTPGIEFQWDGVKFAGVWIPDDSVRESYTGQNGLTRRQWMVKQAESACETYTDWVNGACYRYSVRVYEKRVEIVTPPQISSGRQHIVYEELSDYRHFEPVFDDSCGGFIGLDYMLAEQVPYAIRSALEEIGFSKRAIAKAVPVKGR